MKFEHTEVWGFEHAIRGMRNPLESWNKSDSYWEDTENGRQYHIGEKDLGLMLKLSKEGGPNRKFMRQIMVAVDITAPIYWWKEYDTYKIGTVANSTSTMHKLSSKKITLDCFETDDMDTHIVLGTTDGKEPGTRIPLYLDTYVNQVVLPWLEILRQQYINTKDKRYWKELVRWLPEGWLQTRTCTLNYEVLYSICKKTQRRNHKLTEWSEKFIAWARSLPYAHELIFPDELASEVPPEGRQIVSDGV